MKRWLPGLAFEALGGLTIGFVITTLQSYGVPKEIAILGFLGICAGILSIYIGVRLLR